MILQSAVVSIRAHWRRLFPFLRWWPRVTRVNLKADFFAGLTGAVVVLPQGVAFALIAGLPPAGMPETSAPGQHGPVTPGGVELPDRPAIMRDARQPSHGRSFRSRDQA